MVGRLAPGATIASATAEIHTFAERAAREHPDTDRNWDARVVGTRTAITSPSTWPLLGLLGVVVVFVLLIACANLANLVLARVVARRQEFAVRQALGASRPQLIRPRMTESLLLGIAGGAVGLAIARAGLRLINATAYDSMLRQVGIDGHVLIFTAMLAVLTPLLFCLGPALSAGRTGTAETLRDGRGTSGRKTNRRRNALVASQVALALSLLVLSALVVQTMNAIQHTRIGFDVQKVLTSRVELPKQEFVDEAARATFARNASAASAAIPGATAAAVLSHLPVFDDETHYAISNTPHDAARAEEASWASWYAATPDAFRVLGIAPLAGRTFTTADVATSEPVAILNRLAAEKFFDRVGDAVGRRIVLHPRGAADRPMTIVGVVSDTRNSQFTAVSPQIHVPFDQWPSATMTLVIRSDAPASRAPDVRAAMRQLSRSVAIQDPQTMMALVDQNTADNEIVTGLFLGFALLALALASAGLCGVISYSVGSVNERLACVWRLARPLPAFAAW